jgi:hypothetical protein
MTRRKEKSVGEGVSPYTLDSTTTETGHLTEARGADKLRMLTHLSMQVRQID